MTNDKFIARSILKFHWDPQLPATFWLNCCHGPLPRVSFGSGLWEQAKKHLGVQVTPLLVFKWLGIMPGNSSVQMARFLDKFEVWHSMHINIFFNKKALHQIICGMQNLHAQIAAKICFYHYFWYVLFFTAHKIKWLSYCEETLTVLGHCTVIKSHLHCVTSKLTKGL